MCLGIHWTYIWENASFLEEEFLEQKNPKRSKDNLIPDIETSFDSISYFLEMLATPPGKI